MPHEPAACGAVVGPAAAHAVGVGPRVAVEGRRAAAVERPPPGARRRRHRRIDYLLIIHVLSKSSAH